MSEKQLHRALIRLAHRKPELRRHLVPILRNAATTPEGAKAEFGRYKQKHPETKKTPADFLDKSEPKPEGKPKPSTKAVEDAWFEKGEKDEKGGKAQKAKKALGAFLKTVKGLSPQIKGKLEKAPSQVQRLVSDSEFRSQTLKKSAKMIAKGAKGTAKRLAGSAKSEVKELKHAAKASKKLFKVPPPPGPFTKEDKKAFYAAGAYVAGALLSTTPMGALTNVGISFAKHVSIKAVHEVLDQGFLHFEWGESLLHAAHMITGAEGSAEDRDVETLIEGLTLMISETLKKGISDEEMKELLAGKD